MKRHTILFLAANPSGTDPRALDQEARAIQAELERSGYRDCFEFETRWAAEPLDLLRELRKLKPTVVHFSGHEHQALGSEHWPGQTPPRNIIDGKPGVHEGEPQHGLLFHGAGGRAQVVSTAALEKTIEAAGASVRLVVLSACYSEVHAAALLAHVDCVVGMSGSIDDEAARSFAIGFYGGLGEAESVAAAYKQGCAAITLEGLRDTDGPQLKVRDGVDVRQLVLARASQVESPTISIKALGGVPVGEFDVQYRMVEQSGLLRIEPQIGYLDRLKQGGPIEPVHWTYTPFCVHVPTLDVKIVNNTKDTLFFEEVILEIEQSMPDLSAILLIHGFGFGGELPLVNLGWGDLLKCIVRFNIGGLKHDVDVYKYTLDVTDEVNDGGRILIADALADSGIALDAAREADVLARSAARVVVSGVVDYVQQDGISRAVRFMAIVLLGPPPMEAHVPPSMEYDVELRSNDRDYSVRVPISHALPGGGYDRFTIRVIAGASSEHTFVVKLVYNNDRLVSSPRMQLDFFASKADQRLFRGVGHR